MSNGDTMRLIVNSAIALDAWGQTMYPSGFTAYGIVEFEMFDGKVYASAGADVALDALQTTVGNESSGLVKDMTDVKAQLGSYVNADFGSRTIAELLGTQGFVQKLEVMATREDDIHEELNNKILNDPIINPTGIAHATYSIMADIDEMPTEVIKLTAIQPGAAGNALTVTVVDGKPGGAYSAPNIKINCKATSTAAELTKALQAIKEITDIVIIEVSDGMDEVSKISPVAVAEAFTGGADGTAAFTGTSEELNSLVSTKIVVGVTPSVCTTKAYKRFGTAANHLKIEALTPGTVMNGWSFTNTGSSVSNLTASAFVSAASKLVTLRYATNTSAESVSITPASLAAVLNITPVSAYFLTTVSGTVSNFGSATGLKVFTGLTASGANNGTVAAMGKIYIASGFGAMHICVSTTDGSQVSNASYFKTVSLT
jgi:hypothetical protein